MTIDILLTTAYGAVGALGVCAYFPQLLALIKDTSRSAHVPMSTWVLWGVQTQVVTTYALVVNGDMAFVLVNLFSMVACNACLAALVYNRYFKRENTRALDALVTHVAVPVQEQAAQAAAVMTPMPQMAPEMVVQTHEGYRVTG